MAGGRPGRGDRRWLAVAALAGALLAGGCAAPAWSAAGATAVARDTAGPTTVILPPSPTGNLASQTAAATVQTPLPAGPSATPAPATGESPGDIDLTLQPCADQACASENGHLWLARPIPGDAGLVNYIDRSYPYGSTQNGLREPHHGVEFANSAGTPVLAAGDGVAVVAGGDLAELFGPIPNFYGRLVVIEHDQAYAGQAVYSLYGHLRSVAVNVGQRVTAGDLVGQVGSAGVAIGPHLHFEVRVGRNAYDATRNPELWLLPLPYNGRPNGVIAGRVLDRDGNPIPDLTVAIRPIATESDQPRNRFIQTYSGDPTLQVDERLRENFAIGDMPRGQYSVSVSTTKFYQQNVTVRAGEVTLVTFIVNRPDPTAVVSATPTEVEFTATATAELAPAETPVGDVTATLEAPPAETPTAAP